MFAETGLNNMEKPLDCFFICFLLVSKFFHIRKISFQTMSMMMMMMMMMAKTIILNNLCCCCCCFSSIECLSIEKTTTTEKFNPLVK